MNLTGKMCIFAIDSTLRKRLRTERKADSVYVYLFELDSVRNSEEEIRVAERALFHELVVNGNQVIISLNQLTDSVGFYSLLKDERKYEVLLELFDLGALKINLYGNMRTPSQYVQNALEQYSKSEESGFLFSGIPVEQQSKTLFDAINNAIRYGDLQGLRSEIDGTGQASTNEDLEYIYRFCHLILSLNVKELATNPAKSPDARRQTNLQKNDSHLATLTDHLESFQKTFESLEGTLPQQDINILLKSAFNYLNQIYDDAKNQAEIEKLNNRSFWIAKIREQAASETSAMAEAVVDLCYNFVIEKSILKVSVHRTSDSEATLFEDFYRRLHTYWTSHCGKENEGSNGGGAAKPSSIDNHDLSWESAIRIIRANHVEKELPLNPPCYEEAIAKTKKLWQRKTAAAFAKNLFVAFFYIVLFVGVEYGVDKLSETALWMSEGLFIPPIAQSALDIVIFGLLGSLISTWLNMPDLLDNFRNIGHIIMDTFTFFTFAKKSSKTNSHGKAAR